jgi:cellulose synthase/poly-beta-1,6-N-acetylglucosamine synthase-like glycosyltransferase
MHLPIQDPVFYAFAFVSALYVIHLGLYLVAANFYDIYHHKRQRERRFRFAGPGAQASRKKIAKAPLVSVIIAAHNEEKVIVRSLNSLRRSTYPNIEFLVADDASHDGTKQLVHDYMLRHPDMNLHVYRMRRNVGKGAALNALLRRHVHGEFVMTLDADSIVRPDTIQNSIAYFADPNIAGVAANVRIMDEPTIMGVLQKFEHMVGYRSKKMYSLLNCEFVVGGVASSYRMDVLRKVGFYDTDTQTEDIGLSIKIVSLGNHKHRMIYAADVVAMTEGVASFRALMRQRYRWKYGSFQNLVKYHRLIFNLSPRYSRSLTMYRMPMALLSELSLLVTPFAWGYLLYITFIQYNLALFIGAYITVTLYILLTIWLDENLQPAGQLRLSAYALISYFIFYLMDLVQMVAIARCVYHSPALLTQKNVGSNWVSPKRVGGKVRHVYEA